MTWKVIDSNVIGNSHLRQGKPCQDYVGFCNSLDGHLLIGVVADGASSAKHSDKGAEIAVKCAIKYLDEKLKMSNLQCPIKDNITANNFFMQLLEIVKEALEKKANNNRYPVKELACTLIVFIASPDWLAAMQVGDGFIVIRQNNHKDYNLLFKPNKGEFINCTTFVTSRNAGDNMQVFCNKINLDFICAATDWCENIAVTQLQNWQPLTGFFKPLEDCVLTNEKEINKSKIDSLLNSELVNNETDDDKTLLLCVWDDSQLIVESKRINNAFLISVVIKSIALLVILFLLFLIYKLKQPVATSYFVNDIAEIPIPITLEKKPLSIDVWVLTSLELLDKEKKTITVTKEATSPIYLVNVPSQKQLDSFRFGYLHPGTYRYFDAKKIDRFYPEAPQRWVLIKMSIRR
ncbi:PP2C family serine/threonine-protein phosphatase [Aerosakkonema funiforme]|uniref:PP2C family serine/threonine-protein phosphatase n=1 Tax=Aerosakkonema funiforme TaxID=1246630 RepID=UPI0035B6BA45